MHALPVQLTDAVVAGLVHCENRRTSTAALLLALNTQLAQKLFEIGFVNGDFPRRLPMGAGLDCAFIKRLEEAHLGNRIFFGAGKRAAGLRRPAVERGLVDKDFKGESGLPVDGDDVSKLAARAPATLPAVSFKEIILIHEAVGSRVALDAANGIRAGHAEDYSRENERSQRGTRKGARPGDAEMEHPLKGSAPNWNKASFEPSLGVHFLTKASHREMYSGKLQTVHFVRVLATSCFSLSA